MLSMVLSSFALCASNFDGFKFGSGSGSPFGSGGGMFSRQDNIFGSGSGSPFGSGGGTHSRQDNLFGSGSGSPFGSGGGTYGRQDNFFHEMRSSNSTAGTKAKRDSSPTKSIREAIGGKPGTSGKGSLHSYLPKELNDKAKRDSSPIGKQSSLQDTARDAGYSVLNSMTRFCDPKNNDGRSLRSHMAGEAFQKAMRDPSDPTGTFTPFDALLALFAGDEMRRNPNDPHLQKVVADWVGNPTEENRRKAEEIKAIANLAGEAASHVNEHALRVNEELTEAQELGTGCGWDSFR